MTRVAVTGLGILSSNGNDVETFWSNCLEGRLNVAEIPESFRKFHNYTTRFWSPLSFDDPGGLMSPIEAKRLDPSTQISLLAVHQALLDSGLPLTDCSNGKRQFRLEGDSSRMGVCVGTGMGGVSSLVRGFSNHFVKNACLDIMGFIKRQLASICSEEAAIQSLPDRLLQEKRFNPFSVSMTMVNAVGANIAIRYGLNGASKTFCSACASGTISVGQAFQSIRCGEADIMVACGVDFSDPFGVVMRGFDTVSALTRQTDRDLVNRPFDRDRDGFLFSQGASAVLILENLDQALKRNAHIYAEVTGFSENCDAYNIMAPDTGATWVENCMRSALAAAGTDPGEVDYVNAHGTGTQLNDEMECNVIRKVYTSSPRVNSTKSLIGHTLGASGAVEALVCALSIDRGELHPSRNISHPIADDINWVTRREKRPVRSAVSHSFAFGGHNAVITMKYHNREK